MLDLQNQNEKERYEAGKLLISEVFQKLSELDICVNAGVSNYSMGYLSITRAFKQAEEAIHIGNKVEAEKRLFYYEDYLLYYMLIKAISKAELEELYEESWKVIDEFDEKNHMNFAETLEAYINCNMNAAEAAEKLYIHRNTMLYRMEKIRDLLKVEKFNGEQNLFLLIGLAAKRVLFEIM
jgi:purine catabolism regulator